MLDNARAPTGGAPRPLIGPGQSGRLRGLALAAGTTVATVISYLFTLALSRSYGPVDFGAIGALLSIAVIASVPASALQLVLARRIAAGGTATRTSWAFPTSAGLLLTVVGLALVPLVVVLLRLPSAQPAVWLAVLSLPQMVLGAQQGVMLGRGQLGRLAAAFVLVAGTRLAAGVLSAFLGWDLGALMLAVVLAAVLAVALLGPLVRASAPRGPSKVGMRGVTRETLVVSTGLAGLLTLLNVDVLLARTFLDERDAGLYAFATIFGRITFWGTHFVALQAYPRWAARDRRGPDLAPAVLATAALGAIAVAITTAFSRPIIVLLAGEPYADVSGVAPWFAVAGTLVALVQLALFADVARTSHVVSGSVWGAVAVVVLAVTLGPHETIADLLLAVITTLAALATASLVYAARTKTSASVAGNPAMPLDGSTW